MSGGLATLLRLRHLEVEAARRALGQAITAEAHAALALARTEAALREEALSLETGALLPLQNFVAWLPRGTLARQAAAHAMAATEAATASARQALAQSSGALRAAEVLAQAQAQRAQQQERRREGHRLDEAFRAGRSQRT